MAKADKPRKGLAGLLRGLIGDGAQEAPAAGEAVVSAGAPAPAPAALRPPAQDPAKQRAVAEAERKVMELRRRREAASMADAAGSALYHLSRNTTASPIPLNSKGRFSLAAFVCGNELPTAEQRGWLQSMDRIMAASPSYSPKAPPREKPVDGVCHVRVGGDAMSAYIFLVPPLCGGKAVTVSEIKEKLARQGVSFGVNEYLITVMVDSHRYLSLTEVAAGERPTDGEDGEVIDHFSRKTEIELSVKDNDTIDFKDLGWLQTVLTDEVICDIIPPVPPKDGTTVRGQKAPGRPGKPPPIPQGQGTRLLQDESALVAGADGVVTYDRQRFRVDPLLIIQGDVDNAVGNLDVVGSVLVHGDVREGFEVKATLDVTVKGRLEGATVAAGGRIRVGSGINGNGRGEVAAGGDVIASFIENARVIAGGRVVSGSIVHSTVLCDDSVEVMSERGTIIGGQLTVQNQVRAKTIGNPSSRSIEINLGNSAAFVQEKREVMRKRDAMNAEIAEKLQSIEYLQGRQARGPAEQTQLDELKMSVPVLKMQAANLERHLQVMNRQQNLNSACRLTAGMLYPPVELMIGGADTVLRETLKQADIRLKDGKIVPESGADVLHK